MKKLMEYQNEEALDLLAAIIEPAGEIFGDKAVSNAWAEGYKLRAISAAIKNHKKDVMSIMATLEGVSIKDYKCNVLTLPTDILTLMNDPELVTFFNSQVQMMQETSFTPATENTEAEN